MVRVLGIDPDLTRCGLGGVEGAPGPVALVAVDVVRTPAQVDLGARPGALEAVFEQWLAEHRPDAVAVVRAARRGLPVALRARGAGPRRATSTALLAAALLTGCAGPPAGPDGAGGGGSDVRGTAATEQRACAQAREQDAPLVDRFVAEWAPVLLDPAGQRTVLVAGPLPAGLQPARYGELSAERQLGLTSCLARHLADRRTAPPDGPAVTDCSGPCVDVYRDSYIATTGTPLEAGVLRVYVFDRDSGMLPDPSTLLPEPQPVPVPTLPPPPAVPPGPLGPGG